MVRNRIKQLFFENEASGGILLLITSLLAFTISNSFLSESYFTFINIEIFGWTLLHLVNDGLMAIFFYVVGLEIKEEVFKGELSDRKKSAFAIFGALGGMIVPALVYFSLNSADDLERTGWAIPMATDIAFAVGILALLGKRVPTELKIFLLALAIVDDLGAVIVIALFLTKQLYVNYLLLALIPFALIFLLNKYKPQGIFINIFLGVVSWYLVYKSGVHATIAGVILAFLTPFEVKSKNQIIATPLKHWLHTLHPIIAFAIMPIFAFFNAGLSLEGIEILDVVNNNVALGAGLGLLLGKPIGIFLLCYTATVLKIAKLPTGVGWPEIIGVGFIAGMGFTMSLFINGLTFGGTDVENFSKIGILSGSITSAVVGYFILSTVLLRKKKI